MLSWPGLSFINDVLIIGQKIAHIAAVGETTDTTLKHRASAMAIKASLCITQFLQ